MAAPNTNWVYDNDKVSESSKRALDKARKTEREKIRDGWRWIKLSSRTKVFVPCDNDGRPTEEGKRIMRGFEKTCT